MPTKGKSNQQAKSTQLVAPPIATEGLFYFGGSMYTNVHNLPISLALWLAYDDYDHNSDDNVISATSLLKPTKSLILGSKTVKEESIDISTLVPSRMGTAIHTAIETAWLSDKVKDLLAKVGYPAKLISKMLVNPDPETVTADDLAIYMEIRSSKDLMGYTISGKFDFICDGQLEDFKSTGTYTWIKQSNKEKYIQQGSIYRWLNPTLVTNDIMRINYIFTDWSAAKAKQSSDYPKSRVISQEYVLMSLDETESFIKNRLSKLIKYKDCTQEEMPQCTSEELWERESVYKYYKNPEKKTRSTGNFSNYYEAHQRYIDDGGVGEVVTVKGEVVFCKYCPALAICKQAQSLINEGRLNL